MAYFIGPSEHNKIYIGFVAFGGEIRAVGPGLAAKMFAIGKAGLWARLFCRISRKTTGAARRLRCPVDNLWKVNRKKIRWGARAPGPGARRSDVRKARRAGGRKNTAQICEVFFCSGRRAQKKSAPPAKVKRSVLAVDTLTGGAHRVRPDQPCTAIVAQAPEIVKPQRRKSRSSERKGGAAARLDPCAAATMKGARAGGGTQHRPAPRGGPPKAGARRPATSPALPGSPQRGRQGRGGSRGEPNS